MGVLPLFLMFNQNRIGRPVSAGDDEFFAVRRNGKALDAFGVKIGQLSGFAGKNIVKR